MTDTMYLNMGPQHPSTHGVLRLAVEVDGETILAAKPDIGYLHRCFEKTAEGLTYPQVLPYTDRTDYVSAMTNEFAYVLAVEKLLGLEVPPRAQFIRVIMAELQRIANHLVWFGTFALDMAAVTPFLYAFRDREKILDLFERASGARLTYSYYRIGGVRKDIDGEFVRKTREFLDYFEEQVLPEYHRLLTGNRIFEIRTQGTGYISPELVYAYGLSGPMARGSGVPWDVRKNEPYSGYDRFEFEMALAEGGDNYARYMVRMKEMAESAKIIRQALDGLPEGDCMGKVPKIIKPPVGEVYVRIESPKGELGVFLVSDGSPKPYRLKWRAPSFSNLQVTEVATRGEKIADLVVTVGSIDVVLGEVDR